jgi:dienelactone hydrolase
MWLSKLASPGNGARATTVFGPALAKPGDRRRSGGTQRRMTVLLAVAVAVGLAGCGGSHPSSAAAGPAFPSTPAGVQGQWLLQALGSWPIPDAAIRAHFSAAILAATTPADLNVLFAEWRQLGLVSVTNKQPDSVEFVVSVRGGQRFRVDLTVDAHGLINGSTQQELPPTVSPASVIPALAPGWVAQPVTFQAGGMRIYGTYTHPGGAAAGTIPAALLIASLGGSTDRNDNAPGDTAHRDDLVAVANWLSADGVASLRYDKLGSGQTGWGPYAAHPDQVGIGPYEQEAVAALDFLAAQRQVDRARLAVFGHSEGGIYALLLAAGLAGPAPKVRAVGLLEPVPIRMLDLLQQGPIPPPQVTGSAQQAQLTPAQARSLQQALARAVTSLRRIGTLPPGMPRELVAGGFIFPTPLLEFAQIDRYDPAAVAARLPTHTAVLLT